MTTTTHFATLSDWDGKYWCVTVDGIPGATQGRTFLECEQTARELIALTLDIPEDSFEVMFRQIPNGAA